MTTILTILALALTSLTGVTIRHGYDDDGHKRSLPQAIKAAWEAEVGD